MAEEANLTIVINARDNASAALAGVESAVAKLQSAEQKSVKTGQESDKGLKSIGQTAFETAKGISNTVQEVGGFVDGLGKIKKATEAGGVLAKFAPALSAISSVAGPAALAIAGVTTATVGMYKAAQAYEEYKADWSRGGYEMVEELKLYTDKINELNGLQEELKNLQITINNPETNKAELDNLKNRINEIKQILSEKYNININVNSNELDEAIEKSKKKIFLEAKLQIPDLLDYSTSKKDDYSQALQNREQYINKINNLKQQQEATRNLVGDLLLLEDGYKKGNISQEEFEKQRNQLFNATGKFSLLDVPLEQLPGEVDRWLNHLDNDIANRNLELAQIEATIAEYNKSMQSLAEIGLLEIEFGDTEQGLDHLSEAVRNAGLDMNEYAQAAALAMSGVDSLETAWAQAASGNGAALDKVVAGYIDSMKEFGATSHETATGAALIKNGFRSIDEAAQAGAIDNVVTNYISSMKAFGASTEETVQGAALLKEGFRSVSEVGEDAIPAVLKSLRRLGTDQGLDMSAEKISEMAQAMGLIPESKHVEISADGSFEVIDDIEQAVEKINGIGNVTLEVSAEGDVSVLETADEKLQNLVANKEVSITFNVDTGGFDINNLNGEKIGSITVDGQINWGNTELPEGEKVAADIDYKIASQEPPEPSQTEVYYTYGGQDPPQSMTATLTTSGIAQVAKGTQNFRGGLALVNDERGISDPRELIIDKGRAFIPQGRDVLIPLSRGAKVYTASQTKAMMSALGIPRYASGKDNSEEFILARDNWDHYTKTHAVTTLEELKKWVELSEQFTWNEQDRLDIEEQIFSLSQKYTEELNEQSKSYISDRSFLNDWEEYGDSAEDAFSRVKQRNKTLFDEGKITWEEYTKTMSDVGSTMYDERRSQSERWLEHEEEYNNMSVSDYLSGIDRMKEYTQEYYEMGIIDKRQYIEAMTSLDEQYIDKSREAMSDRFDISESWIGEHTYFNDWDEIGDSPLDAYNRVKEYILESDLSEEEKSKQLKSLASQMYDERKEQSLNWLEEQRKYFGMTEDEYIAGLERIRKYTQEYFDLGLISRQEYNEAMTELKHTIWDEEASVYDDLLAEQSEYISNLRAKFSEEEQALQDSWTVEDREESLSDINRQLDIYRNAVTEQGKEKYQSLLDEKKRLEREEELYNLQKSNNETIEKLQQQYNYLEENKADMLLSLRNGTFDINETERLMQRSIESANNNLTLAAADSNNFLRDIYNALRELPKMMSGGGGSTYNDSRNISITTWDSGDGIYKYINGELAGLGSIVFNGKVY